MVDDYEERWYDELIVGPTVQKEVFILGQPAHHPMKSSTNRNNHDSHAKYWSFQQSEGGGNLTKSSKEKVTLDLHVVSTYRKLQPFFF